MQLNYRQSGNSLARAMGRLTTKVDAFLICMGALEVGYQLVLFVLSQVDINLFFQVGVRLLSRVAACEKPYRTAPPLIPF